MEFPAGPDGAFAGVGVELAVGLDSGEHDVPSGVATSAGEGVVEWFCLHSG